MTAMSAPSSARLAIHLDAVGGVAGDMFVAALLDAFPNLVDRVFADIAAVLPAEIAPPTLTTGESGKIVVRRFAPPASTSGHGHGHHHHRHAPHPAAPVRYPDIVRMIAAAPLSGGTAERAIAILTLLADAEAVIHGTTRDDVHFHELADWDSLVDVLAAGSIAAALPDVNWSVSSLPRGGGLVRTQHGLLPVPAPATTALLTGFTWRDDGIEGERVTPTGAAILRHLATAQGPGRGGAGRLSASGTGGGTRTLPGMPNILRVLVFSGEALTGADEVEVISFDIDDMTGEEIGTATGIIRSAPGVLDVSIGSRLGKKGRPVSDFQVLAHPASADAVAELCLVETSTIGLRRRRESRTILKREMMPGVPPRKMTERPGGGATVKVESDALAGIATLAARREAAGSEGQ
jgi:uncharacterized protein (DUF111 family)